MINLHRKKRLTLRVYFHIDDTDHDFVHARARQQRLYDIYSHTCNLFTSLYWLLFFMLKKLQIIRKYATTLLEKISHLLLQDGDHGKQGLFCFA